MAMFPSASLLGCKLCHVPPLYVANCSGQIYYVVHKLQSISRMKIHFKVHKHLVTNGKCKEFVDKTKRLITKEVDHTPNMKISTIPLCASKTLLTRHVLDDSGDNTMEILDDEELKQIQDKFFELNSSNIHNLVTYFKHCSRGGYINNILKLKSNNFYDYTKNVTSQNKL
jgi:hypothetical protein